MSYADISVKGGKFWLEKEFLNHLQDEWTEQVDSVALRCRGKAKVSYQEASNPRWKEELGSPVQWQVKKTIQTHEEAQEDKPVRNENLKKSYRIFKMLI